MKLEEMLTKQEELLNRLKAIKLMSAATVKRSKDLALKAKEARVRGDYDTMNEIIAEMDKTMKMAKLNDRLFTDTLDEVRRLMVTMYGPVGGQLWDATLKKIDEEIASG